MTLLAEETTVPEPLRQLDESSPSSETGAQETRQLYLVRVGA